jgi:hypothetical protein
VNPTRQQFPANRAASKEASSFLFGLVLARALLTGGTAKVGADTYLSNLGNRWPSTTSAEIGDIVALQTGEFDARFSLAQVSSG